jgi:3-phenylpropionate/trans-cinnamate dioxygenase ferredoxin component
VSFRKVARVEEIPPGQARVFRVEGAFIALANAEGRIHALDGVCPHQGKLMDGARLWGGLLTCPWHNYQYDIGTGENVYPRRVYPADLQTGVRGLAVFPVQVRDGEVWVELQ